MTVLPSQLDVQETFVQNMLSDLHTCMPAEIVAIRLDAKDARCFVDVLPMLQRAVVDEDGELIDEALPVLQMVPVGYPQGGGFFVSLPLAVGDVVLVVFAERSLDSWIELAKGGSRSPVIPGDLSMHSLQGAIALPCGPAPRSGLLQGVDPSDVVLGRKDGTILQRWKPDGSVEIGEGASPRLVALAPSVATELDRIKSDLSTLKAAISSGFTAVGEGSAASGAAAKIQFETDAAAVPSNPGSVAATKTKAS